MVALAWIAVGLGALAAGERCAAVLGPGDLAAQRAHAAAALAVAFDDPGVELAVPVTLHVLRASDGSGGWSEGEVRAALERAARAFAPAGIRFCAAGRVRYVDDDAYWPMLGLSPGLDALKAAHGVPGTIDVYFAEEMEFGIYCGISSYSSFPAEAQGIAVARSCGGAPSDPTVLAHELGHYFDLLHTSGDSGGACTSGADCETTGDFVCDTPPAPLFVLPGELLGPPACAYVAPQAGPCPGDPPYAPDPSNLMATSDPACRVGFTHGQAQRMRRTLLWRRPELVGGCCTGSPCATLVATPDGVSAAVSAAPRAAVVFELSTSPPAPGAVFALLGCIDAPLVPLSWDGLGVPLVADVYFAWTASGASPLSPAAGVLDPSGAARASWTLPAGALPNGLSLSLRHVALVATGSQHGVSNLARIAVAP